MPDGGHGGSTQLQFLLVDDEATVRTSIGRLWDRFGINVHQADSLETATTALVSSRFDAVVVDVRLRREPEDRSGVAVIAFARARGALPAVAYTGVRSSEGECRAAGAIECFFKLEHPPPLVAVKLIALASATALAPVLGDSVAMRKLREEICRVARRNETVLLTGPTGSGKERVARAIHDVSGRRGRFEAVVIGGPADPLLESTLFGHTRGAFTGADREKPGVFADAEHGTVFLDEIGDLSKESQVRLLRVLQEGTFRRVGGSEVLSTARVVCATNVDLAARVAAGTFREDLYYRLQKVPIRVPSLAERSDDIPLLARAFAEEGWLTPTDEAIAWLAEQAYPGNVRQLQNVIHSLDTFGNTGDLADAKDAYARVALPGPGVVRAAPSLELIHQTIRELDGNVSAAARKLGVDRNKLLRALQKTSAMRNKAPGRG